jgi:protein phosphatase
VRTNNEDQYAVIKRSRATDVLLSSLPRDDLEFPIQSSYSLVVADGIGGAQSGEIASRVTLQTMLELTMQATSWVMKLNNLKAQQIRERVDAYVQRMQEMLLEYSRQDPKLAGMGTTWTSAYLMSPHAIVVHVGDSRAYLFHKGELFQITRDETMAQAMIDSGMSPDRAERYRHILLNSFGGKHHEVFAQIYQIKFGPGDRLLLCTDGLYDQVSDDEIAQELQSGEAPQAICNALIDRALAAGGRDNITVVLAAAGPRD